MMTRKPCPPNQEKGVVAVPEVRVVLAAPAVLADKVFVPVVLAGKQGPVLRAVPGAKAASNGLADPVVKVKVALEVLGAVPAGRVVAVALPQFR